jgi:hypothetical protein
VIAKRGAVGVLLFYLPMSVDNFFLPKIIKLLKNCKQLHTPLWPLLLFKCVETQVFRLRLRREAMPTVLSRHQGPSYTPPASSSSSTASPAPTSAQALISHLERQPLPRVTPYLNRLLSAQRQRERDRQLREEQDRAFEDATRKGSRGR